MLEGLKVVLADEMQRIEKIASSQGASEKFFMETAGRAIAEAVVEFIQLRDLPKVVTLLAGKGNNGGDAFAAGAVLLELGCNVVAQLIYPKENCSPLCQMMYEKFLLKGGRVNLCFASEGVILDGLVGTGFQGKAEGVLALAIERANDSLLPIIAIDIPSGLNGNTGEVASVAIRATETIFLGLPKSGFFFKQGLDYVGQLRGVDFGLEEKYISEAKPIAYFFNDKILPQILPHLKRSRHKYETGYVLAVAGSPGMPGAAILSCKAALHSGAGMVRLFHPEKMEEELSCAPFELIRQGWNGKEIKSIQNEAIKAKALLIGPGMGRSSSAGKIVKQILTNIDLPMVIDADALFFLSKNSSYKVPAGSVLTPHHGEMRHLIADFTFNISDVERVQSFAESKKTTIVLKGAPTFIFHPDTVPLVISRGDPGMARAGSGDVLTGMVAAMLAQGLKPRNAAALAVTLHAMAGEAAASSFTSYCMSASDIIDSFPHAFMQAKM